MRALKTCLCLAASALALVPGSAMARQLAVAKVTPQSVACVFTPNCAVQVTDSVGYFKLFGNGGQGKLLVRTYPGMAGTRAAGLTGYSFFIDMAGASALGTPNCVQKLTLDTGPLTPLEYGTKAEVFLVDGNAGAALSQVTQTGNKVTFAFAKPICPGRSGMTESLYFGFAAKTGPVPAKAMIYGEMQGAADVDVRVPKHTGPNS